jgi:hypothetical protein
LGDLPDFNLDRIFKLDAKAARGLIDQGCRASRSIPTKLGLRLVRKHREARHTTPLIGIHLT